MSVVSRYMVQLAPRTIPRTFLIPPSQIQAARLLRRQPPTTYSKPFSTSKPSLDKHSKLDPMIKWFKETEAKLEADIKKMDTEAKEHEDAWNFLLRSQGYSESGIAAFHRAAWCLTIIIIVGGLATVYWGLQKFEIWPFESREAERTIEEEPV